MDPQWSFRGLLLLMLVVVAAGSPTKRRLRVKTIENITASPTSITSSPITVAIVDETTTSAPSPRANFRKSTRLQNNKDEVKSPGVSSETKSKEDDEKNVESDKLVNNISVITDNTKNDGASKARAGIWPKSIQSTTENVVISTSNQLIVTSSTTNINEIPTEIHQAPSPSPRRRNRFGKIKGGGDNHIHVESNYTVTNVPTGNNSDSIRWKNARVKENVRRKNILSRTSAEPAGAGSESRIQVQRSRQGVTRSPDSVGSTKEEGKANTTQTRSRPLIKPQKKSATVYNFETGKLQKNKTEDQSPSTSNEVPNEERLSDELYKIKNQNEAVPKAKKRFSSRYRGKKPNNVGNYKQSAEDTSVSVPTSITLQEEQQTSRETSPLRVSEPEEQEEGQGIAVAVKEEEEENDQKEVSSASAEQKKDEGKGDDAKAKDEKHAEGSEAEHHSDFHAAKGEKHKKGYKGDHDFEKSSKGFHDKEQHSGEYKDEKGSKKTHKEGGGHFEAGVHEEKGQKSADHAEKEEYKKGHSTRGGHVVHKLDEYEKKLEFFDESYDSGEGEKFGSHFESYGGKKGGHKKGGHKNKKSSGAHKAKKGKYLKGKHHHEDKGHDKKAGKVGHSSHAEKYGKEGAKKNQHKYHFSVDKGKGGNGGGKKGHLTAEKIGGAENDHQISERIDKVEDEEPEFEKKSDENAKLTAEKDDAPEEAEESEALEEDDTENVSEEDNTEEITKKEPSVKNIPKNAKFMDEDGPTSYFTKLAKEKTADLEENEESDSGDVNDLPPEGPEIIYHPGQDKSVSNLPHDIPRGKGYFMTEDEAKKDKEGDKALEVFNHLHENDDVTSTETEDGEDRRQRSYEVNEEVEPSNEESRTVEVKERGPSVRIVTKSILPPLSESHFYYYD